MEETQNNLNQTPNIKPEDPQEEKEEKKKNKFVAWWLHLGKWAKVGICAGTAAVLATGITLGIVLPKVLGNNDSENTIILKKILGSYTIENPLNFKKDTEYTFKTESIDSDDDFTSFQIHYNDSYTAKMKSASLTGVKNYWELNDDKDQLTGTPIEKELAKGKILTIKVVLSEDITQGSPSLHVGGK